MRIKTVWLSTTILALCTFLLQTGTAQSSNNSGRTEDLPSAPQPQTAQRKMVAPLEANLRLGAGVHNGGLQALNSGVAQAGQAVPTANSPMRLTRVQAEQLALKNNPQISVGHLLGLAQHQVYRQA